MDLYNLKVPQLKSELRKRGLSTSGRKAVLQERLLEALDGNRFLPDDDAESEDEKDAASKSLRELLADIGIDNPQDAFASAATLDDEFKLLKKRYFKLVLRVHPDKGGSPVQFRRVQTAFEVLREMFAQKRVSSFATGLSARGSAYADAWRANSGPVPSWEYYTAAAEVPVPTYRMERARSNRSKCKQSGELISKGELRVGSINEETGAYGRWSCLNHWRVPNRVQMRLKGLSSPKRRKSVERALLSMNEVLLCGLDELDEAERALVVAHVMNEHNWAAPRKRRKRRRRKRKRSWKADLSDEVAASGAQPKHEPMALDWSSNQGDQEAREPVRKRMRSVAQMSNSNSRTVARAKQAFSVPVPGEDGAIPNVLAGQTCVLTGVFPEVGGGIGLQLGKGRMKALIEQFGGRVTGSVSGRTTMLIVGQQPGFSKVSKARARPECELIKLDGLVSVIRGERSIGGSSSTAPLEITGGFSSGYRMNSVAFGASAHQMAVAEGRVSSGLRSQASSQQYDV